VEGLRADAEGVVEAAVDATRLEEEERFFGEEEVALASST
jgi:hypothetical protein